MQLRDFIADLPDVPEAAFLEFEERARQKMRDNTDDSWTSEREYINAVMAFIDEYEIQIDVPRTYPDDIGFYAYFQDFISVIDYWKYRYALRTQRSGLHPPIYLAIDKEYKDKIHEYIQKIRKVINVSDLTQEKKTNYSNT